MSVYDAACEGPEYLSQTLIFRGDDSVQAVDKAKDPKSQAEDTDKVIPKNVKMESRNRFARLLFEDKDLFARSTDKLPDSTEY